MSRARPIEAPPPAVGSRRTAHLVATLAYAVAAIALTWPLTARLTSELAGNAVDIWIFPWDNWWVGRSLRAGVSPFFTRELYFPDGTSLVFHTLLLPGTAWAALTGSLLSPLTYDNLLVLGALFGSALAAYALAAALTGSTSAAFLAGLIYGFTPNRLDQARAHPDCVLGVWLPLMLLGGIWMLRADTRRRRATGAALAAVAAGLGLLSRPEYTYAGLYLLLALALLRPLAGVRLQRLPALAWCAAICAGALLVIAPYTLAVARAWPPPAPGAGYEVEYVNAAISLERFVVPPIASSMWGGLAARVDATARRTERAGKIAFLGYGLLLLLAGGALIAHREAAWWFWLISGLGFAALSLGTSVQLWGAPTGVALPYADLPLIALVRAPNRLVPAAVLCFALAVAVAWAAWTRRRPRSAWLTAPVGLALALDVAMLPFPTTRPAPSPFYAQLAESAERFGLVEVPNVHNVHDTLYLYYQTIHGKPLHAGHVSRPEPAATARLGAVPLLAALRDAGQNRPPAAIADAAGELRRLDAQGFRYLLFHKRFDEHPRFRGLNAAEQAILGQVAPLLGEPAYEDGYLIAYDLRRARPATAAP